MRASLDAAEEAASLTWLGLLCRGGAGRATTVGWFPLASGAVPPPARGVVPSAFMISMHEGVSVPACVFFRSTTSRRLDRGPDHFGFSRREKEKEEEVRMAMAKFGAEAGGRFFFVLLGGKEEAAARLGGEAKLPLKGGFQFKAH